MRKFLFMVKFILVLSLLIIPVNSLAGNGLFGSFGKKKAATMKVGSKIPNFKGEIFSTGEKIDYEKDYKGKKVVVLDFWSIYCVSCLQEIPKLHEIYLKNKDKDVVFIYVDLDTNKRRLKMFLKKKPDLNPVVMDKRREIATAFNVNILPTTLIIDKEGIVQFYHEGYKAGDEHEIENIIDDLLN